MGKTEPKFVVTWHDGKFWQDGPRFATEEEAEAKANEIRIAGYEAGVWTADQIARNDGPR